MCETQWFIKNPHKILKKLNERYICYKMCQPILDYFVFVTKEKQVITDFQL